MSAREKFLGLLKNDILKLDLADLNFGVYLLQSDGAYVEQLLIALDSRLTTPMAAT